MRLKTIINMQIKSCKKARDANSRINWRLKLWGELLPIPNFKSDIPDTGYRISEQTSDWITVQKFLIGF